MTTLERSRAWRKRLAHKTSPVTRAWSTLILLAGLTTLVLVPPSQGGDEPSHLIRIYGITSGTLLPGEVGPDRGSRIDGCAKPYLDARLQEATQPPAMSFSNYFDVPTGCSGREPSLVVYSNTAIYSPVAYLPALPAAGAARAIGLSPPWVLYAARLGCLLAYVALVALALEIMPRARVALGVVAALPMCIYQAATINIDAFGIALAFVAVACVLRLRESGDVPRWVLPALGAALVGLALGKPTNLLFAPLALLIPVGRLAQSSVTAWAIRLSAAGLMVALLVAWSLPVSDLRTAYDPAVDPTKQLDWMTQYPKAFAKILWNSIVTATGANDPVLRGLIGSYGFQRGGATAWYLPMWVVIGAFVLLVQAHSYDTVWRLRTGTAKWASLVFVALFGLGVVAVFTALYVNFTPVGQPGIFGLQGRYVLPFVPLLTAATVTAFRRRVEIGTPVPYIAGSALLAVISALKLVERFY